MPTYVKVCELNQSDWWQKSFNVLVPLEIQGKNGILVALGQSPNQRHGSICPRILVRGKEYSVPVWAIKQCPVDPIPSEIALSFMI
jgi:hypothetical protein